MRGTPSDQAAAATVIAVARTTATGRQIEREMSIDMSALPDSRAYSFQSPTSL